MKISEVVFFITFQNITCNLKLPNILPLSFSIVCAINSQRSRVNRTKFITRLLSQIGNLHTLLLTEHDHRLNIFLLLSSGQRYLFDCKRKFSQKWPVKKSKLVWTNYITEHKFSALFFFEKSPNIYSSR